MIDKNWELYSSMSGYKRANASLNTAANKAVKAGLASVLEVGIKQAGQAARMVMAKAQEKQSNFGACDSEGNQVAFEIIEEYFPGAMQDRWDYDYMSI